METEQKQLTQWQGLVHAKCPRCRVGNVFNGSTYSLKSQKMNDNCPHCNLKFEREPGYFYVAMFVSYGFSVIEILAVCFAAYFFGLELVYENIWYYCGVVVLASVVFSPFNFRYSRLVLLYWLSPGLHYEPERAFKKKV